MPNAMSIVLPDTVVGQPRPVRVSEIVEPQPSVLIPRDVLNSLRLSTEVFDRGTTQLVRPHCLEFAVDLTHLPLPTMTYLQEGGVWHLYMACALVLLALVFDIPSPDAADSPRGELIRFLLICDQG